MPPLSSYTTTLPTDTLLDTGIMYAGASIFAASVGGIKFTPGRSTREVMFDGKRSRVKGLDRTSKFEPKITGTIVEMGPALVVELEPGAVAVGLSGGPAGFTTGYRPKQAGVLYVAGDYLAAFRVIWQRGNGTYVQCRFFDGAVVDKWDVSGTDNEEAKISVEVCAVLDMTVSGRNTADAPYVIEYFTVAP